MQFHITNTYFYFRTTVFALLKVVSLNKLAHIRNELSWEFNVGIITPWELANQRFSASNFVLFHFCLISVMSGRSHGYLGIISTIFGINVSCSRTQHRTKVRMEPPPSCLLLSQYAIFEVLLICMTMRMR